MADSQVSERLRPTRIPPHSLDAEASLIGAMLLRSDAIAAAVEVVHVGDFYKPAHAHIFDAITSLYSQGEPVDPITVAEELRRAGLLEAIGGPSILVDLQTGTPAISNASHYARIVEENALLRRLINVAGEIAEMGYELPDDVTKALDRAESLVFDVAHRRVSDTTKPLQELLGGALDQLEKLFERGESITGLATGYVDIDELLSGLQPSTLNIVGARPSMGKCVAWDTPIVDPRTGAVATAAELHRAGTRGAPVTVAALQPTGELTAAHPSAYVDDGIRPLFRIRTRLGRTVRITASHPLLTPTGWRPLYELQTGDHLAVPAVLPWFGAERLPGGEVVLLGHVLGLGALTTGAQVRDLAVTRAPQFGVDAIAVLRRHGLWVTSQQEGRPLELPAAVYRLPAEQLAQFLQRLFDANREVWAAPGEHPHLGVRSAALVEGVVHLLLRFGVLATVRTVASRRDGVAPVFEVEVLHRGPITAPSLLEDRARRALGVAARSGRGNLALAERATMCVWDEIDELTVEGHDQVYDLTIPDVHNFVAGDVVVHNTSFALGMATHVAVEAHRPVLLFSLEMGHRELTQRVLSSEARVDSQKLRSGKLTEQDWSKIVNALGRLEAPLWIDDNPNVTVMEIRAKARRMKSRLGDLALIIVDYLQLM